MTKPIASYHTLGQYHTTVQKLRGFFLDQGFLEVDTQSRRSILAACEDPKTIATYNFSGVSWPLPQTGQMWLEYELLKNPDVPGLFCSTTSYRNEPTPRHDRHLTIFPMFEFESRGDMNSLQEMLIKLCDWLKLDIHSYKMGDYRQTAAQYQTEEIGADHEMRLWQDASAVFFLRHFPLGTSPFWNMRVQNDVACKIDTILYGIETIGSAERSTNIEEMREQFHTISNGMYAQLLYNTFGRERVEKELEEFLSFDFFPRYGGGIGVTRLMRALSLLEEEAFAPQATRVKPAQQYL